MRKNIHYLKLLSALLWILLTLSACTRIDLIGFSLGIPLNEDLTWGSFEMVIDAGSLGTWDTNTISDATVILDGDTYKIWYVGHDGANLRIVYAESNDGKTWSNFQEALDVGNIPTYDSNHVYFPTVIKMGSLYKMWYSGKGGSGGTVIIYCDSWNGVNNWSNFQVAVDIGSQGTYDAVNTWSPTVIWDDGKYKMWYSGTDAGEFADRIIYCESLNGKSWSNFRVAVDIGNVSGYDDMASNSPTVIKDGGLYKMWYSGQAMAEESFRIATIYCDSEDGINWDNFRLVMQAGAQGIYDSECVTGPVVINNRGTGMMWYRGAGDEDHPGKRIIYCESE